MDRLEKALCMADQFGCQTILIPLLLWKSQNIKYRLKANIKSLHSMLAEKLRKKIKNINIRILVENPQLIDYFRKPKLWCKRNFLKPFLIQKINSTFSNAHRVHRPILYSYVWLCLFCFVFCGFFEKESGETRGHLN